MAKRMTLFQQIEKDEIDRLYKNLGERVRMARKGLQLRQEELATKIGLSRTSIVNLESGRQRMALHALVAIARALEVSPNYLVTGAVAPKPDRARRAELEELERLRRTNARLAKWVIQVKKSVASNP